MDKYSEVVFSALGDQIQNVITNYYENITEIRLRSDKPIVIYLKTIPYLITKKSELYPLCEYDKDKSYLQLSHAELKNIFVSMCEHSVYKHQENINNGFITIKGGNRVGVCGTAVNNTDSIKNVTDITSMNIRIAKEYIGCADDLLNTTEIDDGLLLCGIPATGKTTMLRDIARTLTLKRCKKVSVIDERMEIAASSNGKSRFDLGFSDIYSGYRKDKAIIMAIRTMSPDYIISDELTGCDIESVKKAVNYGVKMIATVHCDCLKKALKNESVKALLKTGAFGRVVFLRSHTFSEISESYGLECLSFD